MEMIRLGSGRRAAFGAGVLIVLGIVILLVWAVFNFGNSARISSSSNNRKSAPCFFVITGAKSKRDSQDFWGCCPVLIPAASSGCIIIVGKCGRAADMGNIRATIWWPSRVITSATESPASNEPTERRRNLRI